MGLELCLIIVTHKSSSMWLGHAMLNTPQDYEIFDAISEREAVHGQHVPDDFSTFRGQPTEDQAKHLGLEQEELMNWVDTCYGHTPRTPYGERMMAVTRDVLIEALEAGLAKRAQTVALDDWSITQWDPVLGYLRASDPELRIALYWM